MQQYYFHNKRKSKSQVEAYMCFIELNCLRIYHERIKYQYLIQKTFKMRENDRP